MFTGIITDIGVVRTAERQAGQDLRLAIACRYDLATVPVGASIACSGACLTVTAIDEDCFLVDLSGETIARTAAGLWVQGARLNLERALKVGDELGGHIVTGHVDGIGTVVTAEPLEGSIQLVIAAPKELAPALSAKGSITVDGVSLTINQVEDEPERCLFHLNIIPHTAEWTTLADAAPGREVNLEIDVLARYLQRMLDLRAVPATF